MTLVSFTVRQNPTRSVIETRILLAQRMRLDWRLAESSSEVVGAEALVVADSVFFAIAAVSARSLFARRAQIFVAVFARVSRWTVTLVLVGARDALAVHARIV